MRKVTSLTLVIASLIELITSIVLYIIPSGRVAYWSDYHLFGLSKTQWGDIHITVGTLLLIMAAIHLYLNWRPITGYIKNKAKQLTLFTKSFNIALLISLYVAIGTLYSLPPMNYVLQLGHYFSDTANEKYGEPPYGHAELSSLKMFCSRMNIDQDRALALLKKAGIEVNTPQESIKEIAAQKGLTPQQIYDIIKERVSSKADTPRPFPDFPSPGFGQETLADICQIYDLPRDEVISKLKSAGLMAKGEDTVKEVGSNNDSNPMVVFEILQKIGEESK